MLVLKDVKLTECLEVSSHVLTRKHKDKHGVSRLLKQEFVVFFDGLSECTECSSVVFR